MKISSQGSQVHDAGSKNRETQWRPRGMEVNFVMLRNAKVNVQHPLEVLEEEYKK